MTVEEPPLRGLHRLQMSHEAERVLNQLKEITGVEDVSVIGTAMEACKNTEGKYDLERAVSLLVDEHGQMVPPTAQVPETASKNGPNGIVALKAKPTKNNQVIDLTCDTSESVRDPEDDLQKAIALSLKDHAEKYKAHDQGESLPIPVSTEEQHISRALEESLAESKGGMKRKRGEWFVDPINPHERKRVKGWPVGLKNVGNTCWFSVVIQSLFHLPAFRNLVLRYSSPNNDAETAITITKEQKQIYEFMGELRQLFALLLASDRKYVDPTPAIEILRGTLSNVSGMLDSQQDVSEFQHKLLEWLEEAFKRRGGGGGTAASESRGPSKNPMIDLFYGVYKSYGINEGKVFSNQETFGQYPLQVNGFKDLHQSLEASTATEEIEALDSGAPSKSGLEHWFTKMPGVLTFELSRFQFNQQLGKPEKIHQKLQFPKVIYMDRYLESNKELTRQRREEIRKLREELSKLETKLERFMNFGSGPIAKRFPLQDVLQYALEFAQNKNQCISTSDAEMTSPSRSIDEQSGSVDAGQQKQVEMQCTPPKCVKPDVAMTPPKSVRFEGPAPKHVTTEELCVLEGCLQRWHAEVENDVRELQDSIAMLNEKIGSMYSDMKQVPYRLHAVLVHEGQASAGHYWAYIYDSAHNHWLKFNDITVSEASWEELEKESVGGYYNTSAYCLMYVNAKQTSLMEDIVDQETGQCSTNPLDLLPTDLHDIVCEDNMKFAKEIMEYDKEQTKAATEMEECVVTGQFEHGDNYQRQMKARTSATQTPAVPISKVNLAVEHSPAVPMANVNLSMEHAQLSVVDTRLIIGKVLKTHGNVNNLQGGIETAVSEAAEIEARRLAQLSKQKNTPTDHRLSHIMVYLYQNQMEKQNVVRRIMLEQFTPKVLNNDPSTAEFRRTALQMLEGMVLAESERRLYQEVHEDYEMFRKTVTCFMHGVHLFHKQSYQESLAYLVHACNLNQSLIKKGAQRGMEPRLTGFYRRQCALNLNEVATSHFQTKDVSAACDTLQLMDESMIPCLVQLNMCCTSAQDVTAAEDIRSKWCDFLGKDIGREKQEKLQDFLSKLLDPPMGEIRLKSMPLSRPPQVNSELSLQFTECMKLVRNSGYLDKAMAAS